MSPANTRSGGKGKRAMGPLSRKGKEKAATPDSPVSSDKPDEESDAQDKLKKRRAPPRPKAKVRGGEDGWEVEIEGEWVPAVYLDEIRDRVMEETEAQGTYDHPPARGRHALDITSFHADHQTWGEARENRPGILFEFQMRRPMPNYELGHVIDNGRVVLGPDGRPIRAFVNIPCLCSSQMEGFRMEAISREDGRITIADFQARMMGDNLPRSNALSMRKTRFRKIGRCLAWDGRDGTVSFENRLRDDMTDQMIQNNSTQQLPDLTSAEVRWLELQSVGTVPARGGQRALPDEVREERLQAARKRNEEKLKAEGKSFRLDVKQENAPTKNTGARGSANIDNPTATKKRKRPVVIGSLASGEEISSDSGEERATKRRRDFVSRDEGDVGGPKKRKRATNNPELDDFNDYINQMYEEESAPKRRRGTQGAEELATGAHSSGQERKPSRHTSHSLDSGEGSVPNHMTKRPTLPVERRRIHDALSVTRRHWEMRVRGPPEETDPRDSYASQYAQIQQNMNIVWRLSEQPGPVPVLAGLTAWREGHLEWNESALNMVEFGGEVMQRNFADLENDLQGGINNAPTQNRPRAGRSQPSRPHPRFTSANAIPIDPRLTEPRGPLEQPVADQALAPAFWEGLPSSTGHGTIPPACLDRAAGVVQDMNAGPVAPTQEGMSREEFEELFNLLPVQSSPRFQEQIGDAPGTIAPSAIETWGESGVQSTNLFGTIRCVPNEEQGEQGVLEQPGHTPANDDPQSNSYSQLFDDLIEVQESPEEEVGEPVQRQRPQLTAADLSDEPRQFSYTQFFEDAAGINDSPFENVLYLGDDVQGPDPEVEEESTNQVDEFYGQDDFAGLELIPEDAGSWIR